MSDTFDHKQEAFERFENEEDNGRYNPDPKELSSEKITLGYGLCPDCEWNNKDGCNVIKDSPRCILNKKVIKSFNQKE